MYDNNERRMSDNEQMHRSGGWDKNVFAFISLTQQTDRKAKLVYTVPQMHSLTIINKPGMRV